MSCVPARNTAWSRSYLRSRVGLRTAPCSSSHLSFFKRLSYESIPSGEVSLLYMALRYFSFSSYLMKRITRKIFSVLILGLIGCVLFFGCSKSSNDGPIKLVGASQFDEHHAFTLTLYKFRDLVKEYYGKPIEFDIAVNRALGLEKDYFGYMSQGLSIDFGIVSPSHMSTFSKMAPLMDMPFLFRDLDHWEKVMVGDELQTIVEDVKKRADVHILGYAGGGTRNLIVNKPVTNMDELAGLSVRVMGAPIQTRIFQAITAAPTVIAYDEIYNAIQTGVIEAAENEAAGYPANEVLRSRPRNCPDPAHNHRAAHLFQR